MAKDAANDGQGTHEEHMVIDHITRGPVYAGLAPSFERAFAFLRRADIATLPAGTYEIDGRIVYALVQEYRTKVATEGKWEAHRKYIDLQYLVSGRERFGCAPAGRLLPGAYDEARDFEQPQGEGSFIELHAGEFMLLWPGEAHMPGMALGEPAPVRKVVVKIAAG